jgi:hypothetical protein
MENKLLGSLANLTHNQRVLGSSPSGTTKLEGFQHYLLKPFFILQYYINKHARGSVQVTQRLRRGSLQVQISMLR